jgi:hypothetical protein
MKYNGHRCPPSTRQRLRHSPAAGAQTPASIQQRRHIRAERAAVVRHLAQGAERTAVHERGGELRRRGRGVVRTIPGPRARRRARPRRNAGPSRHARALYVLWRAPVQRRRDENDRAHVGTHRGRGHEYGRAADREERRAAIE